jgi:hypothetical protein
MIAWTIYDHPVDTPDTFVARKFVLSNGPEPQPTAEMMTAGNGEVGKDAGDRISAHGHSWFYLCRWLPGGG